MEQSGMRQIDVAKACNVTVGTVANWQHRRSSPGSEQFIAACAACGYSVVLEPMGAE
jgi:transcriptional regulator with XRE-family HTH domain